MIVEEQQPINNVETSNEEEISIESEELAEEHVIINKQNLTKMIIMLKEAGLVEKEHEQIIKLLYIKEHKIGSIEEKRILDNLWDNCARICIEYEKIKISKGISRKFNMNITKPETISKERDDLFKLLSIECAGYEKICMTLIILIYLNKIKAKPKKVYERMKKLFIQELNSIEEEETSQEDQENEEDSYEIGSYDFTTSSSDDEFSSEYED